jgi:hypothetical protein
MCRLRTSIGWGSGTPEGANLAPRQSTHRSMGRRVSLEGSSTLLSIPETSTVSASVEVCMDELSLPVFNYYIDESDPDIVVLRRQDDYFVAAFSAQGATKEGILEAVKEDYRALVEANKETLAPSGTEQRMGA